MGRSALVEDMQVCNGMHETSSVRDFAGLNK